MKHLKNKDRACKIRAKDEYRPWLNDLDNKGRFDPLEYQFEDPIYDSDAPECDQIKDEIDNQLYRELYENLK